MARWPPCLMLYMYFARILFLFSLSQSPFLSPPSSLFLYSLPLCRCGWFIGRGVCMHVCVCAHVHPENGPQQREDMKTFRGHLQRTFPGQCQQSLPPGNSHLLQDQRELKLWQPTTGHKDTKLFLQKTQRNPTLRVQNAATEGPLPSPADVPPVPSPPTSNTQVVTQARTSG